MFEHASISPVCILWSLLVPYYDTPKSDRLLVGKIKSQIYDSKNDNRDLLDKYYLLLCTDHAKHLHLVRAICAELKNDSEVIVVLPRYAWQFYNMSDVNVDAIVDLRMYPEDYIRKQAKEEVRDIGKEQLKILLFCLVFSIEKDNDGRIPIDIISNPEVMSIGV